MLEIKRIARTIPSRWLGAGLATVLVLAALVMVSLDLAQPSPEFPPLSGPASVERLVRCQRAAEHFFRLHQEAIWVYRRELNLNPRQLYIFLVKTKKLADAYYKAAWRCYHRLGTRKIAVPGPVKASFLSDYAWFMYGNPIFFEPPKNAAKLHALLERALKADPHDVHVLDKLAHLAPNTAAQGRWARAALSADPKDTGAILVMAWYVKETKGFAAEIPFLERTARGFSRLRMEGLRYDLQMWEDWREIIATWIKGKAPNAYQAFIRKYPNTDYMVDKIMRRDRRNGGITFPPMRRTSAAGSSPPRWNLDGHGL